MNKTHSPHPIVGVKAGDSLVFCYSGHGSYIRDRNGDEEDKRDETIVPLDYEREGEITDDWIRKELIDKIPPKAKLTVIFDACHSGTIADLKYNLVPMVDGNKIAYKFTINKLTTATKADVACISGCRDDQTSADTVEMGKATGALTFGLIKMLQDHDFKISYEELLHDLRRWMTKNGYSQVPQISFGTSKDLAELFSF